MKRIYLPLIDIKDNQIILTDSYFINYIKNVLRFKLKDEIVILSTNFNYITEIIELSKKNIKFNISKIEPVKKIDKEVILIQSIFKWDRFEWMLEKLVEVGVDKIIPVITNRTTTKINNWEKKLKRFEKIIYKALTQSRQNIMPIIEEPIKLTNLEIDSEIDKIFFDTKDGIEIFDENILLEKKKIAVFIGPEGGIDNDEREFLKKYDFKQFKLNLPILRAETAAIISVAQINMRLNK